MAPESPEKEVAAPGCGMAKDDEEVSVARPDKGAVAAVRAVAWKKRIKKTKRYSLCRKGVSQVVESMVECEGCRGWFHVTCIFNNGGNGVLVHCASARRGRWVH